MLIAVRVVLAVIVAAFALRTDARSQPLSQSDAYVWLQYGADGRPHARTVPSDHAGCPAVTADGIGVAMTVAVGATAGFDRILCDATLPAAARVVRVGSLALPPLPQHVARFIVLGDTGCRISARAVQDCSDPLAWPFARIAASIARESPRPDLIVHVGGYQYREAPCPAGNRRCAGSPYGDNWTAWAVDFFEPGAPLFGTAPLLLARGNHEDCTRSGLGWTHYLAPAPALLCRRAEPVAFATFADLRFANLDSAAGDQNDPDPAAFERDERIADAAVAGRETMLVTHRPPLAYLATHAAGDPNGSHLAAILAGHLHLFATLPFTGAPPAIIVGTGGDTLLAGGAAEITAVARATFDARFGFTVFDRLPGGWSISERDPDGAEHRRCTLRARTVHC